MIEVKELLNKYVENSTSYEELEERYNPLLQILGKLSTVQQIMTDVFNETQKLADGYGVKELRCKIENTLVWLNDYEEAKITNLLEE